MTPEERQARFLAAIRDGADVYMNPNDYDALPRTVSDGDTNAANLWASRARIYPCPFLKPGEIVAVRRQQLDIPQIETSLESKFAANSRAVGGCGARLGGRGLSE